MNNIEIEINEKEVIINIPISSYRQGNFQNWFDELFKLLKSLQFVDLKDPLKLKIKMNPKEGFDHSK